jgi:hypothetical protein
MRGRQHALAPPVGDDRRLQHLGKCHHCGTRVLRAAAHDDERALAGAEQARRRFHRRLVDGGHVECRGHRRKRDRSLLRPGVLCALDDDRSWSARLCRAQRLDDQPRRLVRRIDSCRALGEMTRQARLVVHLVQLSQAAVDAALEDLADQRQHRRVHGLRRQQRGSRIQQSGAGDDRAYLGSAGDERRSQCHVSRPLFVARVHHA